jgi:hypothetical protein
MKSQLKQQVIMAFGSKFDAELVINKGTFLLPVFQFCLSFIRENNYALCFHLPLWSPKWETTTDEL